MSVYRWAAERAEETGARAWNAEYLKNLAEKKAAETPADPNAGVKAFMNDLTDCVPEGERTEESLTEIAASLSQLGDDLKRMRAEQEQLAREWDAQLEEMKRRRNA